MTGKESNKRQRTSLLEQYPILYFILIAFVLSYGLGIPFNMWISQNVELPKPFDIYLSRLITVLSPGISALILMWSHRERINLKRFLPKTGKKHIYLLIPALTFIISVTSLLFGGASLDLIIMILQQSWEQLFIHLILQVIIIGIGEELGWRSWLLPNLNKKYPLLKAMFFVLVTWTLWHFPLLFQQSEILIPWLLIITGATLILTWAWKKYGNNLFLFAVIHGSINYPQFFWDNQPEMDREFILNSWTISGYIYFAIGLIALFSMRKMFGSKYKSDSIFTRLESIA